MQPQTPMQPAMQQQMNMPMHAQIQPHQQAYAHATPAHTPIFNMQQAQQRQQQPSIYAQNPSFMQMQARATAAPSYASPVLSASSSPYASPSLSSASSIGSISLGGGQSLSSTPSKPAAPALSMSSSPSMAPTPQSSQHTADSSFQPLTIGSRVQVRGADDLHGKLRSYAGSLGKIVELPAHPNTWYGVRLQDGRTIKIRREAINVVDGNNHPTQQHPTFGETNGNKGDASVATGHVQFAQHPALQQIKEEDGVRSIPTSTSASRSVSPAPSSSSMHYSQSEQTDDDGTQSHSVMGSDGEQDGTTSADSSRKRRRRRRAANTVDESLVLHSKRRHIPKAMSSEAEDEEDEDDDYSRDDGCLAAGGDGDEEEEYYEEGKKRSPRMRPQHASTDHRRGSIKGSGGSGSKSSASSSGKTPRMRRGRGRALLGLNVIITGGRYKNETGLVLRGANGYYSVKFHKVMPELKNQDNTIMKRSSELAPITPSGKRLQLPLAPAERKQMRAEAAAAMLNAPITLAQQKRKTASPLQEARRPPSQRRKVKEDASAGADNDGDDEVDERMFDASNVHRRHARHSSVEENQFDDTSMQVSSEEQEEEPRLSRRWRQSDEYDSRASSPSHSSISGRSETPTQTDVLSPRSFPTSPAAAPALTPVHAPSHSIPPSPSQQDPRTSAYLTPMNLPPTHFSDNAVIDSKSANMRSSSPRVKQAACILLALSHEGLVMSPEPSPQPMMEDTTHPSPTYAYTLTPLKQELRAERWGASDADRIHPDAQWHTVH